MSSRLTVAQLEALSRAWERAHMGLPQEGALTRPGQWRLSTRWFGGWCWTYVVDRYPEGTVYRVWLGCVLMKLRVKH